jgi:anti-sigma factor RsiW
MDECRRIGERLTPYVDEALPQAERKDVERHLNACPPCRTSAQHEQGGRAAVRQCAKRLRESPSSESALPPGLRSRCEALAREHGRARTAARWYSRLLPAALAAGLIFFTSLALFSLATRRSDALLAAQLTADHLKCFKVFDPHGPTDPTEVEQQLQRDYNWIIQVPPSSSADGLELVSGRRCLYADGTIPHVMYRLAGAQHVSLFRLEGVTRDEAELSTFGQRCRIWSRGGHTYVLVAPELPPPQMARLARYVQQEAR